MVAVKAVHRAWTGPGEPDPGGESFGAAERGICAEGGEHLARARGEARGHGENATSLALPNGSRIVGLPGTEGTVRGFSAVSMLLIDEAARVPDASYNSLRPMLAVGNGDLWVMSTPWGKRGFFYDLVGARRRRVGRRHMAPATECARIPAEFLEEERRELGSKWFAQEYLCEFVDDGAGWFDRSLVEAALRGDEPLWL